MSRAIIHWREQDSKSAMSGPRSPHRIGAAILVLVVTLHGRSSGADDIDFTLDIKPLLSDRCYTCHGPDAENRQADLRLDQKDAALRVSESGDASHIIKPGDPQNSELFVRISSPDPDLRMPPADSNLSLTPEEIKLMQQWIREGANWQAHWSFVAIPPKVSVPDSGPSKWPRNEIDRFVLQRLRAAGMQPASEAVRTRLIRRLSFDLTGLPPTLDEIDKFLSDKEPGAYERLVDRLLASSRFGERMASDWLDVARYSDTYGYQVDRDRFVWPWRDWVIRAFNDNLPHDQFIMRQLAGDLMADATDEMILATTFNRLHPQKVEGGSVPEEFRVEYVADRTQTFATAFLGLTLECARCHDHKYDPIGQDEYYKLFAFFNSIDEAGLYSYFTPAIPTPTLLLNDNDLKDKLTAIEERISAAELELEAVRTERAEAFEVWLEDGRPTSGEAADSDIVARIPGQLEHLDFEKVGGANKAVPGVVGNAAQLTGDDGIGLKVGNFKRYEPFSVGLWLQTPDVKERAVVFHRSRAWTDSASRGYQLLIEDGCLSASLIHFWPGNAIRVRTRQPIQTGKWVHVTMTWDGSSKAAGLKLYVDGREADCEVVRDNLYKNITGGGGDNIAIGQRFRDRGFTGGLVDEFRVFNRELTPVEARQLHDTRTLMADLATPVDKLTPEQRARLQDYYLATVDTAFAEKRNVLQEIRKERSAAADGAREIMVMRELPAPRATYVLKRGAYDAPGEQVQPQTPAVFPEFDDKTPRNRLGLARWLTRPDHPLTARVAVNRLWQTVFGAGLVRTPEDFGSQGELPTHPQLLDWLARDFVDNGWDVKRLVKQMVMSATYRQDSRGSQESHERDPENRLLARAPSYRLAAEMLRDNALAVSGLLVDRVGGAPARPYEVEDSFKPTKRDKGEGLYRRSLYTYWKRTGPAPVMMALDASKRDVCRMRRERTASPIQAFVLLNGPQFVEGARATALRLLQQHGDETDRILSDTFRLLTSRTPTENEHPVLRRLYEQQLAAFTAAPSSAAAYLKLGENPIPDGIDAPRLATLSVVANTLMNLDESVMKR